MWLVIMLNITVLCFTEDHIIVAGYNVDHYCFMFDRGVDHIIVVGYIVDRYCLRFDRGVVHIIVTGDIVDLYFSCLTEEWFILLWML